MQGNAETDVQILPHFDRLWHVVSNNDADGLMLGELD